MRIRSITISVFFLISITSVAMCNTGSSSSNPAGMNEYVMNVVKSFPTDGTFQYWWPKTNVFDGATSDVYYLGEKVMRGDPDKKGRCYCCGLTLQVFYLALQEYEKQVSPLPPSRLTPSTAKKFKHYWFCPDVNSPGPVLAGRS